MTTKDSTTYLRIEVTVAAAISDYEAGGILGKNMADVTFAFGWRTDPVREGERSDAEIQKAITHHMSPVVAILRIALITQGWVDIGQVDDPMTEHGHEVGSGLSTPVRVFVMPENGAES